MMCGPPSGPVTGCSGFPQARSNRSCAAFTSPLAALSAIFRRIAIAASTPCSSFSARTLRASSRPSLMAPGFGPWPRRGSFPEAKGLPLAGFRRLFAPFLATLDLHLQHDALAFALHQLPDLSNGGLGQIEHNSQAAVNHRLHLGHGCLEYDRLLFVLRHLRPKAKGPTDLPEGRKAGRYSARLEVVE